MTTTLEPAVSAEQAPAPRPASWGVPALFTATTFLGAGLLFMVQPLVARLLLPSYGGSSTVWSTASLFFQVLLLVGYGYTHLTTSRLGRRWQPRAHVVALLLPLALLPIAVPTDAVPPADSSPALWLLKTLLLMVALPYVVLSTTGPLVQRWYSWTGGPRADDPYFLFAASNLGSFGGLLAYPFLVEPHLTLSEQRVAWSWAFVGFAVLALLCGVVAARGSAAAVSAGPAELTPRPTGRRMLVWGLLAFLPSTLSLAVTAHLSTDVAPIPLLWVVPLSIYLATFVLAFGRTSRRVPLTATRLAVAAAFVSSVSLASNNHLPLPVTLAVDLGTLALVGYAAHARLAADRPAPDHLTLFYIVIATGGAAGGLVNGLLAPVVFTTVMEFPLALAGVPLLLLGVVSRRRGRYHPVAGGVASALVAMIGIAAATGLFIRYGEERAWTVALLVAGAAGIGWLLSTRPRALAVGLLAMAVGVTVGLTSVSLHNERTFYGSYRVLEDDTTRQFVHGTTSHGRQLLDPALRDTPMAYFAEETPLGDIFETLGPRDVDVVGLGAGTIAAYGRPGDHYTFIEIDQAVVDIARDPDLFTYLSDSPARVDTLVGDGRLLLAEQPDASADLLVLDAFSSDSIPVHLLTEEAMEGYTRLLKSGGAIAVHISNRSFDLEPVLSSAAQRLGWAAGFGDGASGPYAQRSVWVVMAPDQATVDRVLGSSDRWRPIDESRQVRWTDDYSSVLSVLR